MASQGIDSKKPLLYSYFFIDKNQGNLENLKKRLLADNYRLVRLEKIEDEKVYILNVEKIEIHTPKSLHERENQLKNLMKEFKVELYGGWNVDLPDPTKSSASKGKSNKK